MLIKKLFAIFWWIELNFVVLPFAGDILFKGGVTNMFTLTYCKTILWYWTFFAQIGDNKTPRYWLAPETSRGYLLILADSYVTPLVWIIRIQPAKLVINMTFRWRTSMIKVKVKVMLKVIIITSFGIWVWTWNETRYLILNIDMNMLVPPCLNVFVSWYPQYVPTVYIYSETCDLRLPMGPQKEVLYDRCSFIDQRYRCIEM